jgi:hypothetical protein
MYKVIVSDVDQNDPNIVNTLSWIEYHKKDQEGVSMGQWAKCAHLVSAYQGTLANNSLYYIDFRQRNLHNL